MCGSVIRPFAVGMLVLPACLGFPSTAWAQSPFYQATVIAHPASTTPQGSLSWYKPEVSVNEKGQVAFIGYYGDLNNVIVGDGRDGLVDLTRSPSGNHFFPQINNHGQVVWRELLSGNGLISLGRAANPGAPTIIASTTLSAFGRLTLPAISNTRQATDRPTVGFLGAVGDLPFAYYANNTGIRNSQELVSGLSASPLRRFRAQAASAEQRRFVALFEDNVGTSRLAVYTDVSDSGSYDSTAVASTANQWSELGFSPAISDSGRVVAFYGNHATSGAGIYIGVVDGGAPSFAAPIKAFTTGDVIAYNENAAPISFRAFNADQAIGVLHQELDPGGLVGDAITIAFVATPERASRPNPHAGGTPLLFSDQEGIWTLRVDVEKELSGSNLVYHAAPPIPVIQKNGKLLGVETVQDFSLYDPLAVPLADPAGLARQPRRGDHYLACSLTTDVGNWILRFAHLDTDFDGLPDHWETSGIDMDGDGTNDLSLAAFGADPLRADVFLEVDWTNPKIGLQPWRNEPAPGVTASVAAMFENAPVVNPNATTGVTIHVDAGPGNDLVGIPFSVNVPNGAPLDGGELIGTAADTNAHLDRIYFGTAETTTVTGVHSRDLSSIKDTYFGDRDKGARELAFKYMAAADFHSFHLFAADNTPWVGGVSSSTSNLLTATVNLNRDRDLKYKDIKIVSGTGAGQVRNIADNLDRRILVDSNWSVVPDATSRFVVFHGSSGRAEVFFQPGPDHNSFPGNDFLMTLAGFGINANLTVANPAMQWRTIVHEMGHTYSLRHGGIDQNAYKGTNYVSIMSYSYQLNAGSGVDSYSGASDPTYNDWANLKPDFFHTLYFVGNTYSKGPFGEYTDAYEEISLKEYVELTGTVPDLEPPAVAIVAPLPGTWLLEGQDVSVVVAATDDEGVEEVLVRFDLDGDGVSSEDGEVLPAAAEGAGTYAVVFENVQGPFGAREIVALAADAQENLGVSRLGVTAGRQGGIGNVLHSSSGSFPATAAGGQRQRTTVAGIVVPSSGRVLLTVTGTPSTRQNGAGAEQYESSVMTVTFGGTDIVLDPICTATGVSPSICSSYWLAPSGGVFDVEILGPGRYDETGAWLATPAQDYALEVLHESVDLTPPHVDILHPAGGDSVGTTETLVVVVNATDDFAIDTVTVSFDRDGDGATTGTGESVAAVPSGDRYQAEFPNVSGEGGARAVQVTVTDTSGFTTHATSFVEVRVPDTQPPFVLIQSPAPAHTMEQGGDLAVSVEAVDDIALESVIIAFDIDGDGMTDGIDESVAGVLSGPNQYVAAFSSLTGEAGARNVEATVTDTSGNASAVRVPVILGGGPSPEEIIFNASGTIPAQPSVWSGGSHQFVPLGPFMLPGSGHARFVVTSTPNVRQEVQNISRRDATVQRIWFDGEEIGLSAQCNAYGSDPAVCTSAWEAVNFSYVNGGMVTVELNGPGTWNTWGEFSGHAAQDYTVDVYFQPEDVTGPDVGFIRPALGAAVGSGNPLLVEVEATDLVQLASVVLVLDTNGDGDTADAGERIVAPAIGANRYRAEFSAIAGPAGPRILEAVATDAALNQTVGRNTIGIDGAGAGQGELLTDSGVIPGQPGVYQGGVRQTILLDPVAVSGVGRLSFNLRATPPKRREVTNLERHDPTVSRIFFNGTEIGLAPTCNPPGSNPAICKSVWDSPGPGTLQIEILGPAEYNIWGEFQATPDQQYDLEVRFRPGPVVSGVRPATGSISGRERVVVEGAGFGENAVVLFGGVAALDVVRDSPEQLTCTTPPGISGSVDVVVINHDLEQQPWNYGAPYGLFGIRADGFTYGPGPASGGQPGERLLGVFAGSFPAVEADQAQPSANLNLTIPGAGRVRCDTWAFQPILNAIPGPFENRDDLDYHNESSAVRRFQGGNSALYYPDVTSTPVNAPYRPVICESLAVIGGSAAGSSTLYLMGPARWNAFERQFGFFVMEGAPAQAWSLAVWFADEPTIASVAPLTGGQGGGTEVIITGNGFADGARVFFAGTPAADVDVVDPNTIFCATPPGAPGPAAVVVEQQDMSVQAGDSFTYLFEPFSIVNEAILDPQTEQPTLCVPTLFGHTYRLERCEDLTHSDCWIPVGIPYSGDGTERCFTDPAPPAGDMVTYRIIRF